MANNAGPDQLASEANWSGSTLFAKQDISRFSRIRVKLKNHNLVEVMLLTVVYLCIFLQLELIYHIRPNYPTVHLNFSKLLNKLHHKHHQLGPDVQSIVSLLSSLAVKMLTVLVSTISNSQVFLLKKMWVAFANAKTTHIFFQQNISIYAIFNDQSFNDMLTRDIVSFEKPGPDFLFMCRYRGKIHISGPPFNL